MSRIGRAPVPLKPGVEVTLEGTRIVVKGPQGTLSREIPQPIQVREDDGKLVVTRPDDQRRNRALHGLTRALVNNMVVGVSEGFVKTLEIVGVGYRANPKGPSSIELSLGFSHPVVVDAPEGITFEVPVPTRVNVKGIDKELVGQVAANIRKIRPPEPYKGKGVKYIDERIIRKAGKAGK
jgi:large subunit ribosomal protein L6